HGGNHLVPEILSALFMHSRVAHDSELARERRQVNQHRVPVTRSGHAQFLETSAGKFERIAPLSMRDVNTDFARRTPLGLGDRSSNSLFVQSTEEVRWFHVRLVGERVMK